MSSPSRQELDDEDDDDDNRKWWQKLRPLLLFVLLPTLLVIGFEYIVAANQYESEARFIVRAPQSAPSASSLGQMLGIGNPTTPADAHGVSEYLVSHDAIDALGRRELTEIFRRPRRIRQRAFGIPIRSLRHCSIIISGWFRSVLHPRRVSPR